MKPQRPPSTDEFSTYEPEKLLLLWKKGEVTADQMVGYLTLNMIDLKQRILHLERDAPASARATPDAPRT